MPEPEFIQEAQLIDPNSRWTSYHEIMADFWLWFAPHTAFNYIECTREQRALRHLDKIYKIVEVKNPRYKTRGKRGRPATTLS